MNRVIALAGVAAVLCVGAAPAHASYLFQVNVTGDQSDANVGDNLCDVTTNFSGDQCTLRAALEEANALPGIDGINFDIPGPGVHRISPDTALPFITGPVEINGYSQPGARPNTNDLSHPDNAVLRIELSGADTIGDVRGLEIENSAGGTVIKGLVVNAFTNGIRTFAGATIQGNFIGTNARGTAAVPNRQNGLYLKSEQSATVGGPSPADRNLISGNPWNGLALQPSHAITVQGNLIGTQADGTSPLGNGKAGIDIGANQYARKRVIGNVIAFNKRKGIVVSGALVPAPGNALRRNRIFGNRGLGIDLNDDGITPNDPLDADTDPYDLQNYPVLTRAVSGRKATTVRGSLSTTPNESFVVEFFAGPRGSGRQGKLFIGQRVVSTDGHGRATFAFRPARRVPVGRAITATATNSSGSTSEFSAPRAVTAP